MLFYRDGKKEEAVISKIYVDIWEVWGFISAWSIYHGLESEIWGFFFNHQNMNANNNSSLKVNSNR